MSVALSLTLSFAFVTQAPSDLGFTYAMERSVWGSTHHGRLEPYVGQEAADAVRTLGSAEAHARRLAYRALAALPHALRHRVAILGTWHEDAQVRAECLRYLEGQYLCLPCQGLGGCGCRPPLTYWCPECWERAECQVCHGSGTHPAMLTIRACTDLHAR